MTLAIAKCEVLSAMFSIDAILCCCLLFMQRSLFFTKPEFGGYIQYQIKYRRKRARKVEARVEKQARTTADSSDVVAEQTQPTEQRSKCLTAVAIVTG